MAVERGDGRETTGKSLRQGRGAATGWVAVLVLCACGVWGAVLGAPQARKNQGGVQPAPAAVLAAPQAGAASGAAGQPPEASASWQALARQQIAAAEYEVTWQKQTALASVPAAWQAPNRAHDFRTYFTPGGIRVVPRTAQEKDWEWSLTLAGYGRGDSVWPVVQGAPSPTGNRVDYNRGGLDEWYVNSEKGLEQGFVLPAPPEKVAAWGTQTPLAQRLLPAPGRRQGIDPAQLIHLDLELAGGLMPVISTDGQAIDFQIPGGVRVVHYGQLQVTSADGTALPSWMEGYAGGSGTSGATTGGIRIVIDAAQAVYPLTVDPLATSPAWTAESNQISAYFGTSVATAGDVNGDGYADIIVGAKLFDNGQVDEGRAFVYLGSAAGLSVTSAWTAEGDQMGAHFGTSVSTAGDVNGDGFSDVIVGADFADNGQSNEGIAYVYHGSATGLAVTAAWQAESNQVGAFFGGSVSTAGDVDGDGYSDVIVGALRYDNGQADEGRAYVYLGSAVGLNTTAAWIAESDQASAWFGQSVSTAGDVNGDGYADVIVGASSYDNGQTDEGRVFVYEGSATGLTASATWTAESDQGMAFFGTSVSTAGDVNGDGYADVLVGGPYFDNGQSDEGRAFLYLGSATGPAAAAAWTAESDQANANFAAAVSTAGDINGDGYADVLIGARRYDSSPIDDGKAFLYLGSAAGLGSATAWSVAGGQAGAQWGESVSTAGDVNGDGYSDILIGAPFLDGGQMDEGRASVFLGSATGLSATAAWVADGDQAGSALGVSVSTAGDVNGDGYADVVVGAYLYDNGQTDEGRAYLYLGSSTGLATTAAWTAESDQVQAWFGISVSTAGDVNGDGYSDVLVGASYYDHPQVREGRAYLYLGSALGLATTAAWTAESDQAFAWFGSSLCAAGDVNGDGYGDVIIGAYGFDNGQTDEGRAYVYLGSPTALGSTPAWMAESDQTSAWFGYSVSTAGDVNGDGFSDVIVGAITHDNGQTDEGRAYLYLGSAVGPAATAAWTAESDQAFAWFGSAVSSAGDVNGDGYGDVIIGAHGFSNDQDQEGRAYLYLGSALGLSGTAGWMAEGDQVGAFFGSSVSRGGDVNGDGYADVLVGTTLYDNGQTDEGRAYLYLGSASGLGSTAAWTAEGNQVSAWLGGVSAAGDVNGDGYADVILGASGYDSGLTDAGRVYLYFGNGGAGLSLTPQQWRSDDTVPIADTGWSRTPGGFRLKVQGRSPFGRGRLKAEYEVKAFGLPLNGSSTVKSAAWTDSGTARASFNELIAGLPPDAYHWRMRLLYDPATTPFQGSSRWFTVPWNGAGEMDLRASPFIGGAVWNDLDGDGLRGSLEPGVVGVMVRLLDASSMIAGTTVTDATGAYRFEIHSLAASYRLSFVLPAGSSFTLSNQGVDDAVDSDADPVTGETALIAAPFQAVDATRWSAGLQITACSAPSQAVIIANVRQVGTATVLDVQDGNPPGNVTGYNIYRSSDPSLAGFLWPLLGADVVDMDSGTPGIQWSDGTGAVSPTGVWFYDVTAYNHICNAEGPR